MPHQSWTPGSPEDMKLAARLVVEGVVPESTMRAVFMKQQELVARGHPITAGEICRRKGWTTGTELRWLANPEAPPADLLPGLVLGSQIGTGGMSRVYRAGDLEAGGGDCAVKILLPALRRRKESVEEFEGEARNLIGLDHPNIVKGRRIGQHDGVVFLVMELVDGRCVQAILDDQWRVPEEVALSIILQTARALQHLHEKGLVHRDVKPANILVGPGTLVKLCDLGLSVASGAPESEITAGTIPYIAPEQASGASGLDVRSDIYSLGVSLFQMVVGRLPFGEGNDREALARRLLEELRSPELQSLKISQYVHYFIQRMMALDPAVRYQSPEDLIRDVEEHVRGFRSLSEWRPDSRPLPVVAPRVPGAAVPARTAPWPPRRRTGR
jgi:serine/threonine protein kinase